MYTVYIVFAIILALSFVTGNIVLVVEHKRGVQKKKNSIIYDKEVL